MRSSTTPSSSTPPGSIWSRRSGRESWLPGIATQSPRRSTSGRIGGFSEASQEPARELVARASHRRGAGPGDERGSRRAILLVAGRVPDRRGLLLDPGLHPRHRGARGRGALAHSNLAHRAAHALGYAADVPRCRPGKSARTRFYLDARTFALVLAG